VDLVGWILVVGGAVALLVAGVTAVRLLVKAFRGTAAGLTDPGAGRLLVVVVVGLVAGVVMVLIGGNILYQLVLWTTWYSPRVPGWPSP
jgi:hypothetical protein